MTLKALLGELRGDWRAAFDAGTLARGETYVQQGRVLGVRLDEHEHALVGRVRGSEPRPYISRAWTRGVSGKATLHTQCSCPVAAGCKHVAAMLIWVERDEDDVPVVPLTAETSTRRLATTPTGELAAWNRWLAQISIASASAAAPRDPQRVLGFLIGPGHGIPAPLGVTPVLLRRGKTGALVDPKPLPGDHFGMQRSHRSDWSAREFALLSCLSFGPAVSAPIASRHLIVDPNQEQALEEILREFPCFFEKPARGPLIAGPTLKLHLSWEQQADGSQRLRAVPGELSDALLMRGHGLWYVDAERHTLGRVDGDAALAEALLRAPLLQPEDSAGLAEQLRAEASGQGIPTPAVHAEVEVVNSVPTPILRLRSANVRHWTRRGAEVDRIGLGRLQFDYDGARLTGSGPERARGMHDGQLREIVRHTATESAATERLFDLGLAPAELADIELAAKDEEVTEDDFVYESRSGAVAGPDFWLHLVDDLQAQGFKVEYEASFPAEIVETSGEWFADAEESGSQWFDLSLGIEVGGARVDLLPILRRALSDPTFPHKARPGESETTMWLAPLDERRRVALPVQRVRALLAPLLEWLGQPGDHLHLRRAQAGVLDDISAAARLPWQGPPGLRDTLAQLAAPREPVLEPLGFNATLRPYQRDGLAWLDFLHSSGLGGVLADDMGLGKTVQVLAHLLALKLRGALDRPALVVAPTSLVWNWRDEAQRFAPDLRVLVLHGAARASGFEAIATHDLVITTYPLLSRDRDELIEHEFALLILDEAQAVKNARTQAARVVRELQARRRLAMTGTPLENHLGELWAQFDAVEPGLLGDERHFVKHYRTPIEKHGDVERQQRLNRRIAPLMLRRRKEDVLADLPDKTIITRPIELSGRQRELYETLRLAQHDRVREAIRARGLAQSGIVVLDALLKLRQVCCDPRLVKLDAARGVNESAKLELLLDLLDALVSENRRVLVFSQFAEMLALISTALDEREIKHLMLTGQSRDRASLVKHFQSGVVPVFLISLKAGGVGLNLTAADSVIHYDPWWNPAAEAQATDRAHRIGQDKAVFVYKLICSGTVEEKIQALQTRKAELAAAVLDGGTTQALTFDPDDLNELFAPL